MSGGLPITGAAYEYIVLSPANNTSFTLTYAAASGKKSDAKLTHRVHLDDLPQPVADVGWAYTDATNTAIKLTTGKFTPADIYEFSYKEGSDAQRPPIRRHTRLQLVPAVFGER